MPTAICVGLSDGRIGSLRGLDGKPLDEQGRGRCRGMARLPDGSWLVSFERHHRIWHYPTLDGIPAPINLPEDFEPPAGQWRRRDHDRPARRPPDRDQRGILACQPGTLAGWIGQPAGKGRYAWQSLQLHQDPRLQSDLDWPLPDGGFVLLERAFDMVRGVRIRIMRFDAADFRPGATVTRARAGPAGLAATRSTIWKGLRPPRGRAARRCCG